MFLEGSSLGFEEVDEVCGLGRSGDKSRLGGQVYGM